MSRIDIENLIYKKPSLITGMNALMNVHYMGGQEDEYEPIPTGGTNSKETGDMDHPVPTPGTNP